MSVTNGPKKDRSKPRKCYRQL